MSEQSDSKVLEVGNGAVKPLSSEAKRRVTTSDAYGEALAGKYLRVGNKLYLDSSQKSASMTIHKDKITATDPNAIPDLVRIAKTNNWTTIQITNGSDDFKKAVYLEASRAGMKVRGYEPDALTKAEGERSTAKYNAALLKYRAPSSSKPSSDRTVTTEEKTKGPPPSTRQTDRLPETMKPKQGQSLSEKFLAQSHRDNARDPDTRSAQTHVAYAIAKAKEKYPDDKEGQKRFVDNRKAEIAQRLHAGETIAAIQSRAVKETRMTEIQRDQIRHRSPSR